MSFHHHPTDEKGATALPGRFARSLTDKILIAFHQSCDHLDFEVADGLLVTLGMVASRQELMLDSAQRRLEENIVAAHERLWALRNPPLL